MKTLSLLESEDKILAGDWIRPLYFISEEFSDFTAIEVLGVYSGLPSNNIRWVKAGDALGEYWIGKTLGELNNKIDKLKVRTNYLAKYEIVRGDIPVSHQWKWREDKERADSMCGVNL